MTTDFFDLDRHPPGVFHLVPGDYVEFQVYRGGDTRPKGTSTGFVLAGIALPTDGPENVYPGGRAYIIWDDARELRCAQGAGSIIRIIAKAENMEDIDDV